MSLDDSDRSDSTPGNGIESVSAERDERGVIGKAVETAASIGQRVGAEPDVTTRWFRDRSLMMRLGLAAIAFASFALILRLHGLWPRTSQPTVQAHLATGAIECLRNQGISSLTSWCPDIGAPAGQPLLSGLPQTYLGWMISYLPGVGSWRAHVLVDVLCDAGGFAGCYLLVRKLGGHRLIAIGAAFSYLASLQIIFINGFAATWNGFVLMPLHAFVAWTALEWFASGRRRIVWGAAMVGNALVLVFTDGYGFMESMVLIGIVGIGWYFVDPSPRSQRVAAAGVLGLSTIVALGLYLVYVPSGAYDTTASISYFRAMGADLATLVAPQSTLWWARLTGVHANFRMGWGDFSASRSNYLGVVALVLSFLAVIVRRRDRLVQAFAAAGFIGGLLSLGPSLKVHDLYERDLSVEPVAFEMPASQAFAGLPTRYLFDHLPGFNVMRATYRWNVLAFLCVVILAAWGVSWLWDRRVVAARLGAVALGVLAVVDLTPDVRLFTASSRGQYSQLDQFRSGPLPEFVSLMNAGDRVLFLPVGNDFLANELGPVADVTTYNIGIDKNYFFSRSNWPPEVLAAHNGLGTPSAGDTAVAALQADVDAIVVPHFNLQLNALSWPPEQEVIDSRQAAAAVYSTDPRLVVTAGEWYTVVRLSSPDPAQSEG